MNHNHVKITVAIVKGGRDMRKRFSGKTWIGIVSALVVGVIAFCDERSKTKQEEKIEKLEERVNALESEQ